MGRQNTYYPPSNNNKNRGKGGNNRNAAKDGQNRARCDAVAPYNFIPFEEKAVIPAFEDGRGFWSGKIVCSLEALQPLLVSGGQNRKAGKTSSDCRFMQVNGKNVIPGTSIKGMLRNLLEILSFSRMQPVTDTKLFWRRVDRPAYRYNFASEEILGGYLRKRGSEYFLVKVDILAKDPREPPEQGRERIKTGGIQYKDKKTGQKKWSKDYYFSKPEPNAPEMPIDAAIVATFESQLTPAQEERWGTDKRIKRLAEKDRGLPVFYRLENGKIAELGFCRYFRIQYKYSPRELAFPENSVPAMDFAMRLFGAIYEEGGKKKSLKGRVSVDMAEVAGELLSRDGMSVILGSPKPTCLPLYLRQNPDNVRRMKFAWEKNDISTMKSYNDSDARLRGFKLYWHHGVAKQYLPGIDSSDKGNVSTRLYPLAKGAKAEITIHVDHLTDAELGGLLECIELPRGHAHKLGMGKSLGFGSVRLEIAEARVQDMRKRHSSLLARLDAAPEPLPRSQIDMLKELFRSRILDAVRERFAPWKEIGSFDDLPPIKDLRIMLDYAHRPDAAIARTMTLQPELGKMWTTEVNFRDNAILPSPGEVIAKG